MIVNFVNSKPQEKKASVEQKVLLKHTDHKFDVFSTHQSILNILEDRIENLENIRDRMGKLKKIIEESKDKLDVLNANKELFKLNKIIRIVENRKEYDDYMSKAIPILQGYKDAIPKKTSFLSAPQSLISSEMRHYFLKFVCLAKNYIDVGIIREDIFEGTNKNCAKKIICTNCSSSNFTYINDTLYSCECGTCIEISDDTYSYKDVDRINLTSRFTYTKDGHFKEAMIKYQCKQTTVIPEEIYTMCDREIKKHGIKLERLKRTQIIDFLTENGYNDYYSDASLIFHTITKTDPPNIKKYENELLRLFKLQDEMYEKIKNPDRLNSLNVYYKLFKLLEIVGYKCKFEEFGVLKQRDRVCEHDEKWMELCEKLEWPYKATI